jgi:aclacinomycin oxidase
MSSVAYDPEMDAYVIEAGTTLGEVYRRLFLGWGVVLPAGQSPDVGIGGHALGGRIRFLHRRHGLAVDYLYAVEVVVVGEDGTARSVIASREPSDPNHELWWAHTGCGGGKSRCRHPILVSLAPKAPESVVTLKAEWAWKDLDERAFQQLVCNYEEWCERNGDEKSPYASLFSVFTAGSRQFQAPIELRAMSIAGASAERQLDEHLASVAGAVGAYAHSPG